MKSTLILSSLVSLSTAACGHGTTFFPHAPGEIQVAEFGFDGLNGPLNWHGLNRTYGLCANGTNQSPVNINSSVLQTVPGSSLGFYIDNAPSGVDFFNLGSTVEAKAKGTLSLRAKKYSLVQFHFHTPSEHRIDNEHYPMEVHFVFQATDNALAVIGFLIELRGNETANGLLSNIFENVGKIASPGATTRTGALNFTNLASHLARSNVFQYTGSLTTPPCTEGLAWNVVQEPIYVDVATYRAAKAVMKFNSRYTQNESGKVNLLRQACTDI